MIDSIYSTVGKATAGDIRNIKERGILLPIRSGDEKMIIFPWEDQMCALALTGPHAFLHFPVSAKTPHKGLFISDIEILVDFESATDALGMDDTMGLLILKQDKLSLIGKLVGDGFNSPHEVPLWISIDGGSDTAKIAFTRWAIGMREGDEHRILWEYEFDDGAE